MRRSVRVELVVVGDKVLSGQDLGRKSSFLERSLAELGLAPSRVTSVGDDVRRFSQAVASALSNAELVFVTGGMGPTCDDRSAAAFLVLRSSFFVHRWPRRPLSDSTSRIVGPGGPCQTARRSSHVVHGVGPAGLEQVVGALLQKRGLSLATAESCTGGVIGDRLTDVPGSSAYYLGGVVAYSNDVKRRLLGVRPETLKRHGAVSSATVLEMAKGIRELFRSGIGLAVSGIAGPGGGTERKPVGLVYTAVSSPMRAVFEKSVFSGNRRTVKERAAASALDLCRRLLEDKV